MTVSCRKKLGQIVKRLERKQADLQRAIDDAEADSHRAEDAVDAR